MIISLETQRKQLLEQKESLIVQLSAESIDQKRRIELQRELARVTDLLAAADQVHLLGHEISQITHHLVNLPDPEMRILLEEERKILTEKHARAVTEFEELLAPRDPFDDRSVFLEIRAGAGGQEAALFAADLIRMYTNYALKNRWRVSLIDESFTDLGGIRDATLHIEGKGIYGALKFEAGVHRVQRVPKTETAGRVHTSTATVVVLPEAEEVDVQINPADLRIDTLRSGGAGGQHVNKTESAVRITHIPTGIVVVCQEDRSQHKNKATALKVLQSRLLAHEREKQEAAMMKQRKEMIGTGMRAEKVRTYNFPQNRVTDHQVDLTLQKLDRVIAGELDDIIEALKVKEREDRRKLASQS